jgi:hypothetical protein
VLWTRSAAIAATIAATALTSGHSRRNGDFKTMDRPQRPVASSRSVVSLSQMFSGHQHHQLRPGLVQQPVQIEDRFATTI